MSNAEKQIKVKRWESEPFQLEPLPNDKGN